MLFFGQTKPGLRQEAIERHGLLGKKTKPLIQHVFLREKGRRKDGCFGAVFQGKQGRDQAFSGKRIGDQYLETLIKHILFL